MDSWFNQDISKWNVSNVEDMGGMFFRAKFDQDISNWNVSNVRDMDRMFQASDFNQDISNWKVSEHLRRSYFIFRESLLEENKGIPKWYK